MTAPVRTSLPPRVAAAELGWLAGWLEQGTLNVDTGGSSDRKNTVCGTSGAPDQPAEIGGRGFDSPPPVFAPTVHRLSGRQARAA